MMPPPVLYSFRRCPYAMRARLALAVGHVAVELREVVLRDKPAAMLAASPKGTVPVLVSPDGGVVDQSLAIMHWALRHNDPEGWATGDDPALIADCDDRFKHHLDRTKYPDRHESDPIAHRAAALAWLGLLETRLSRHAWLCGPTRALADAAIMPFVRQFAAIDADWFAQQPLPGVQAWLARWLQSPLFAAVMVRFDRWTPEARPIIWSP
jgi:glutathione S-transferase